MTKRSNVQTKANVLHRSSNDTLQPDDVAHWGGGSVEDYIAHLDRLLDVLKEAQKANQLEIRQLRQTVEQFVKQTQTSGLNEQLDKTGVRQEGSLSTPRTLRDLEIALATSKKAEQSSDKKRHEAAIQAHGFRLKLGELENAMSALQGSRAYKFSRLLGRIVRIVTFRK